MDFIKKFVAILIKIFTNFYFTFLVCFSIWMIAFDDSNIMNRYKLWDKKKGLEDEKEFYTEKIKEVEAEKKEIMGNNEAIEKFAREKYLMKKPTEEVFIIKKK